MWDTVRSCWFRKNRLFMEDKREQFGHDGLEGTGHPCRIMISHDGLERTSHSRRIRENEPVY